MGRQRTHSEFAFSLRCSRKPVPTLVSFKAAFPRNTGVFISRRTGVNYARFSVFNISRPWTVRSCLVHLDCVGISTLHAGYECEREGRQFVLWRRLQQGQGLHHVLMYRYILRRNLHSCWQIEHHLPWLILQCVVQSEHDSQDAITCLASTQAVRAATPRWSS